ncbi:MAG TPA: DivIVA domain-containing protein, partial [Gaiellaceae bacterium]|nr:DivIVA domain-containing protein [Gaiellaceae bacterium]
MADEHHLDGHLLRLEDVTAEDLPLNVRGFDRHAVERRLARVAESYSLLLRQRDELRQRLEAAEARVVAAEDEARVSAREVAALTHRTAAADDA